MGAADTGTWAEELALTGPGDVLIVIALRAWPKVIEAILDFAGTTRLHALAVTDPTNAARARRHGGLPRSMSDTRMEKDSMGEVRVPAGAYFAAQTQRAVENFPVSGQPMRPAFVHALGHLKAAAAFATAYPWDGTPSRAPAFFVCAQDRAVAKRFAKRN